MQIKDKVIDEVSFLGGERGNNLVQEKSGDIFNFESEGRKSELVKSYKHFKIKIV